MSAVVHNHPQIVEFLLKKEANVNAQDLNKKTALCLASEHGYETCITILSNHGADPFLADVDGKTALENAVVSGCRLSARKLLSSRSFSRL